MVKMYIKTVVSRVYKQQTILFFKIHELCVLFVEEVFQNRLESVSYYIANLIFQQKYIMFVQFLPFLVTR